MNTKIMCHEGIKELFFHEKRFGVFFSLENDAFFCEDGIIKTYANAYYLLKDSTERKFWRQKLEY